MLWRSYQSRDDEQNSIFDMAVDVSVGFVQRCWFADDAMMLCKSFSMLQWETFDFAMMRMRLYRDYDAVMLMWCWTFNEQPFSISQWESFVVVSPEKGVTR